TRSRAGSKPVVSRSRATYSVIARRIVRGRGVPPPPLSAFSSERLRNEGLNPEAGLYSGPGYAGRGNRQSIEAGRPTPSPRPGREPAPAHARLLGPAQR